MIHCGRCGQKNSRDFSYCLSCGADLAAMLASVDDAGEVPGADRGAAPPATTGNENEAGAAAFTRDFGALVGALTERAAAAIAVSAMQASSRDGGRCLPLVPPAPRRPSERARRLVHAFTGTQKAVLWVGLVLFVVGVGPAWWLGSGLFVDVGVALLGHTEQGTIVAVEDDLNIRINNRRPRRITFRLGEHQGTSSTLDHERAAQFAPDAPCEVETVAGLPWMSRVKGTSANRGLWIGGLVALLPALGLLFATGAVRANRREVRAFTSGASTVGRVTSFGPDLSTRINGRHPFVLAFSFVVDGATYSGSLGNDDAAVLQELIVDGQVPVLYDPRDPSVNTLFVA